MHDAVEDDCPVRNSLQRAEGGFAAAKVAERIQEKARRDQNHQHWIDEYSTNGPLAEIRDAFGTHDHSDHS